LYSANNESHNALINFVLAAGGLPQTPLEDITTLYQTSYVDFCKWKLRE